MISFEDFKKLNLVAATVTRVEDHPRADRLLLLTVDLGGEERTLVAGIKEFYSKDELLGKRVAVVENLQPASIRGVESRGMILAAKSGSTLSLVTLDREVAPGTAIS